MSSTNFALYASILKQCKNCAKNICIYYWIVMRFNYFHQEYVICLFLQTVCILR